MTGTLVAGVVLAGGQGRRLGAAVPKPMVAIGGRAMIRHVLDRFPPSVSPLLVSANEPDAFSMLGLPVVADRLSGRQGPLAGLDAAAAFLRRAYPGVTHLLSLPGDTPVLPADLGARMAATAPDVPAIASVDDELHPTIGLWPIPVLERLPAFLERPGQRAIKAFLGETGFMPVPFAPSAKHRFHNVNTPEDVGTAERLLRLSTGERSNDIALWEKNG